MPLNTKYPCFICDACFEKFIFNHGSCCTVCGRSMGTETNGLCLDCAELKPYFKQGVSLFALKNVGRNFIYLLKYHHGTYLKQDLMRLLEHERSRIVMLQGSCFVPVPLHFIRQWKRGYNQSELIAKAFAVYMRGEYSNLLYRKINTRSQTSLTRNERKENIKGAFMLRKKCCVDSQKNYVLVDDVFTTGATLNECARVLHDKGARTIRVFTLAHG